MVTLANVTKAYLEIKNGCSNSGCYSSLHYHLLSLQYVQGASLGKEKRKTRPPPTGKGYKRKKNPNDEHLIQTFTMTHFDEKRAFIFGFVIVVRAHFN